MMDLCECGSVVGDECGMGCTVEFGTVVGVGPTVV